MDFFFYILIIRSILILWSFLPNLWPAVTCLFVYLRRASLAIRASFPWMQRQVWGTTQWEENSMLGRSQRAKATARSAGEFWNTDYSQPFSKVIKEKRLIKPPLTKWKQVRRQRDAVLVSNSCIWKTCVQKACCTAVPQTGQPYPGMSPSHSYLWKFWSGLKILPFLGILRQAYFPCACSLQKGSLLLIKAQSSAVGRISFRSLERVFLHALLWNGPFENVSAIHFAKWWRDSFSFYL